MLPHEVWLVLFNYYNMRYVTVQVCMLVVCCVAAVGRWDKSL